jgi:hypothetical protein
LKVHYIKEGKIKNKDENSNKLDMNPKNNSIKRSRVKTKQK